MPELEVAQPTVEETQVVTPPAEDGAATAPAPVAEIVEDKFVPSEDTRDLTRQASRAARELSRLQQAIADRKAELGHVETQLGDRRGGERRQEPATEPEAGDEYEGETSPQLVRELRSLRAELADLRTQHTEARGRLDKLTEADADYERQEAETRVAETLRSACSAARKDRLPDLDTQKGKRADAAIFNHFDDLVSDFRQENPEQPLTEDKILAFIGQAVEEERAYLTSGARLQLAANRKAAASQPPSLGGSPSVTAPKAYSQMTEEEKAVARAQAARDTVGKHLTFKD